MSSSPSRSRNRIARRILPLRPLAAAAALGIAPAIHADPPPDMISAAPQTSGTNAMPMLPAVHLSPDAAAAAEAGIEAMGKNKFDDAETAFLKLLHLSPDNPSALVNLGLIEFRLGKTDGALGYLERAIRVKPDAFSAWLMMGVIYMNQDNIEAATAALAQAVYLNPKNPQAHNYFAVTLAKRGWNDAAEDELQKVIELDPDFAEAHFNLALVYFQQSPPAIELARRHYQKALDLGASPDPAFAAKLDAAPEPAQLQ